MKVLRVMWNVCKLGRHSLRPQAARYGVTKKKKKLADEWPHRKCGENVENVWNNRLAVTKLCQIAKQKHSHIQEKVLLYFRFLGKIVLDDFDLALVRVTLTVARLERIFKNANYFTRTAQGD